MKPQSLDGLRQIVQLNAEQPNIVASEGGGSCFSEFHKGLEVIDIFQAKLIELQLIDR